MKKQSFLLALLLFIAFIAGTSMKEAELKGKSQSEFLGEYLYTVPIKKEQGASLAQSEWWHEYLEYPVNQAFLQPIMDKINAGQVKVYKPEYPFTSELSQDEIKRIMVPVDSFAVEDQSAWDYRYVKYVNAVKADQIVSITFYEDWYYDKEKLELSKHVKGIILHFLSGDRETYQPAKALFYIPFPGVVDLTENPVKGISCDMNLDLIPFDHNIPEAVTTFTDSAKVRKEKEGIELIISSLKLAAGKKGTVVCDTTYPYTRILDKTQRAARVPLINAANNIRFVEDWGVNVNTMAFVKTVRGICLTQLKVENVVTETERAVYRHTSRCAFFPSYINSTVDLLKAGPFVIDSFYTQQIFGTELPVTSVTPLINADSAGIIRMSSVIADRVKAGTLTAYASNSRNNFDDPWMKDRHVLDKSEINDIYFRRDSVGIETDTAYVIREIVTPLDYSNFHGFGFYESWMYDPAMNVFTKNVRSIGMVQYKYSEYKELKGAYSIYNIDPTPVTDPATILKPEFLVSKGVLSTYRIDGFEQNGYEDYGGDVGPSLTDYSGNFDGSIYPSLRYQFFQQIMTQIDAGKLIVYDPQNGGAIMSAEKLHSRIDSLKWEGYGKTDLSRDYTFFNELTFTEDWYYDPSSGQFYKKVTAITFVFRASDEPDENWQPIKHEKPMFTIKCN